HARFLPDGKHRGGFAQLTAVIRGERAGCQTCLLLNAGDLVQGTPVSTLFRGLPVYEVANHFGFDASTIGNHEFDYGWQRIAEFARSARFPFVSANAVDGNGKLLAASAYVIRNVGGLRVAIIGALTTDLPALSTPDLVGPWRTLPVVETVRKYAAEVQDKSDLIVVLGHINPAEEDALLSQAPEVGVIISGHLHAGLDTPHTAGQRVMVRVKAYGEELGRLDLVVDVANKTVARSTWKHIPIDADVISPAPDVAKLVAGWEAKVSRLVDIPIGEAKREFAGPALQALMAQAMADETGADFAFMNKGGVRDFIPQGPLLARHIWNIMPFDNRVLVGRFKGSQLPRAVTDGRPVDPDREYTLAVNDFTAANQSTEMGSNGLVFPSTPGPLQRDLLIDWIKKKKVLQ
ncbi:MAG: bifunctional metallophosphatase/5'-nucleotidase, partial [Acidobacteria bacterium]|nr:bifunctional metallophosphatase/5'-nucleotidase [Acidobacteriota bacterium]